jgi:hypothetical protein
MSVEIRLLQRDERSVLDCLAPDVFDHAVDQRWSAEFRHSDLGGQVADEPSLLFEFSLGGPP